MEPLAIAVITFIATIFVHEICHFLAGLIKKEPIDAFVVGVTKKYGIIAGVVDHDPSMITLLAPLLVLTPIGYILLVTGLELIGIAILITNTIGSMLDIYLAIKLAKKQSIKGRKTTIWGLALIKKHTKTWREAGGIKLGSLLNWEIRIGRL